MARIGHGCHLKSIGDRSGMRFKAGLDALGDLLSPEGYAKPIGEGVRLGKRRAVKVPPLQGEKLPKQGSLAESASAARMGANRLMIAAFADNAIGDVPALGQRVIRRGLDLLDVFCTGVRMNEAHNLAALIHFSAGKGNLVEPNVVAGDDIVGRHRRNGGYG